MAHTIIIGDGPGGLSAALFLAKAGHTVTVFGQDATPMHHAQLYNYLGIPDISGTDFQRSARRHAADHGAVIDEVQVTDVDHDGDALIVRTDGRGDVAADYLVLAGGKANQQLATDLGLPVESGRVVVDQEFRTQIDRVYAIGRLVRPGRSQAIISAGAGATAALDILSREAGTDVHDWDTPPEHDHDHPNL